MKPFLLLLMLLTSFSLTACSGDHEHAADYEHAGESHDNPSINDPSSQEIDSTAYDVLLYEDDSISITLTAVQTDNVIFSVMNKTDEVSYLSCTFITLDDRTYHEEDTNYSTPTLEFAPGETREYAFCEWGWWNEFDFAIENTDCETISVRFEYCTESQEDYSYLDTGTVDLK